MTVLKWSLIVGAACYFGFVTLLYFAQRSILYPIPEKVRTSPAAAGFPEAEQLPQLFRHKRNEGMQKKERLTQNQVLDREAVRLAFRVL